MKCDSPWSTHRKPITKAEYKYEKRLSNVAGFPFCVVRQHNSPVCSKVVSTDFEINSIPCFFPPDPP